MVAPVTGPYGFEEDSLNKFHRKVWWRQRRPYSVTLPYTLRLVSGTSDGPPRDVTTPSLMSTVYGPYVVSGKPQVDNVTYSKLVGKLHGADADLGILLGEHRSSVKMINERMGQIVKVSSAILRRDLSGIYRALRQTKKWAKTPGLQDRIDATARGAARKGSGLILEYSWGWKPMLEDIYNSLEVLTSPILHRKIRASHNTEVRLVWRDERWSNVVGGNTINGASQNILVGKYTCSSGCTFEVANPNVALANRLGVINPIAVAWAVTPFSFLVDKYVNIGQMLASMTDLYGFQTWDTWTKRKLEGTVDASYQIEEVTPQGAFIYGSRSHGVYTARLEERVTTLLTPSLSTRQVSVGSLSEAISYVALLVQLLVGKK